MPDLRNLLLALAACATLPTMAAGEPTSLRLSVYATAGDVLTHLATPEQRQQTLKKLAPLHVARLFLEGRRGDEYAPPAMLRTVRDFFATHGIECSGGIATVPGSRFGVRQKGDLGWLNWQNDKTQGDIAGFFAENAPMFDELIVDDFYCTADTSQESDQARGTRSWGEYRRDLLVSLIEPMIFQPARAANPDIRLILKYPQWYDRFHLFGYDPARMSPPFDQIWVGTEVRNPATRRMGFVQPTEGYMNFRWLTSVAGDKVTGAWFDHIECGAEHFVDQAFQSVLAGARELTLFHLGDLVAGHPGDALLAGKLPDLRALAAKVHGRRRAGVVFYKPPDSDADENLYLADYLGMIGLPLLPEARFPAEAKVVFLGVQAAADPTVLDQARRLLESGGTLILTPAFIRATGGAGAALAGVRVGEQSLPAEATSFRLDGQTLPFATPLQIDGSLRCQDASVAVEVLAGDQTFPLLTDKPVQRGRVLVLNLRTFSEQDFRDAGEWLLAPKPLGLPVLPEALANNLRAAFLSPLNLRLEGPAGVGLYLFGKDRCLYNFHTGAVTVRLDGVRRTIPAKGWLWIEGGAKPTSSAGRQNGGLRRQGRVLLWNDRPIQLVGCSYYGLIGDRSFDAEAFLDRLAAHHVNFTRFFLILPWPVEPGPNRLPFAKAGGKYDLHQFDEDFFRRLRAVARYAETLGIVCQVCLFDRCGLAIGDHLAWDNNPYNADCNINGLLSAGNRSYPAFCHTKGDIARINARFVTKVVETIGDCRNVIYEIMNEPYRELGSLREWHVWVADILRANLAGRPGSKLISSTGAYDEEGIDLFSMHRAGSEAHVAAAMRQGHELARPVIFSDDGDSACMFRPEVTVASAARALRLGQHFEHLEYTLALQRENEHRAANRLDQLPALCLLNLRNLSALAKPYLSRPFIQPLDLKGVNGAWRLSGQTQNAGQLDRVLAQRSKDGGRTWEDTSVSESSGEVTTGKLPYHPAGRTLVRFLCVDRTGRRWPGPSWPYGPANTGMVALGEEIVEAGLMRIRPTWSDGAMRLVQVGGQSGHATDRSRRGKYAYFRLDAPLQRESRARPARVSVTLFDQNAGTNLLMEYDGAPGAYTAAEPVELTGSASWKSVLFVVKDAVFQGRQNDGADFRLSLVGDKAELVLKSVTVSVTATSPGNVR